GSPRNPAAEDVHLGFAEPVPFSRRHRPALDLFKEKAVLGLACDDDRAGLSPLFDAGRRPQIEIPLEGLLPVTAPAFGLQQRSNVIQKRLLPNSRFCLV